MDKGRTGRQDGENGRERGERRARGFTSAADSLRRTLREAAAKRGFAEPRVLTRWREIAGERLAGLCTPVKVSYPRGSGLGATLVVHAEGPRATEVEHLAPRIIERINQFYGYRAITRLRVVQVAPAGGFGEAAARYRAETAARPPDRAAQARAAELARGIENEPLRLALTRLGAHILARGGAGARPRRRPG